MKKSIFVLLLITGLSCSRDSELARLKLNVDRPADVKQKIGDPDSVRREVMLGATKEVWYYRADSLYLRFYNDILQETMTEAQRKANLQAMYEREQWRQDSIVAVMRAKEDSAAAALAQMEVEKQRLLQKLLKH